MNVKTCCRCCCSFSLFFVEYLHIFWLSIRCSNFNLQLLLSFASRVNLLACHFSAVRYWFIGVTHCALFTTIFDLSAAGWAAAAVGEGGTLSNLSNISRAFGSIWRRKRMKKEESQERTCRYVRFGARPKTLTHNQSMEIDLLPSPTRLSIYTSVWCDYNPRERERLGVTLPARPKHLRSWRRCRSRCHHHHRGSGSFNELPAVAALLPAKVVSS